MSNPLDIEEAMSMLMEKKKEWTRRKKHNNSESGETQRGRE